MRSRNPDDDLPKDFPDRRNAYYAGLNLTQDARAFWSVRMNGTLRGHKALQNYHSELGCLRGRSSPAAMFSGRTNACLPTNQCHERADHLLNSVGLGNEVDGIVYSAMAGYQKPHSGFYSFAERKTGYRPEDLLMVDDKLENVEAAMAAGWQAVHWTAGDSLSAVLQGSIG